MAEYSYSLEHVEELRRRAVRLGFLLPEGFRNVPLEELAAAYNGIGPDRWSSRFRRFTTWVLKFLEAPALIHDWQYTVGGSYRDFSLSNWWLVVNTAIEALDLRKTGLFFAGIAAAVLCQLFGWRGFRHGQ